MTTPTATDLDILARLAALVTKRRTEGAMGLAMLIGPATRDPETWSRLIDACVSSYEDGLKDGARAAVASLLAAAEAHR